MAMKKIFIILLTLPFLVGCNDETPLLADRDKIVKYLTSSRNIVAEEDLGNVIEENPPFYTLFGRYTYRHIVNYYDEGREDRPQVAWGDRLQIRFNAYTFTGSEPTTSAIYWSNVPHIVEQLAAKSGNTLDWSTEPLTIELGQTELIKGLEYALPGCHEADSVQIFMTSTCAYGKKLVGSVPKNSMVAWYLKIEKIEK